MRRQKGITPVIAIVLLLLVTVGAVGTVYTQFQDLVEEPDTEFLDNVDMDVQTVTRNNSHSPGTMQLRLQNKGEQEYNLTDSARMEYSVPGESQLDTVTATTAFSEIDSVDSATQECFTEDAPEEIQSFGPGDTASCDTAVSMPSSSDEVTLYVVDDSEGEEIADYECSPSTSSSSTC